LSDLIAPNFSSHCGVRELYAVTMPHLPFACIKYSDSNNLSFLISECSSVNRALVKLVTVYEPDKDLWIDYRFRKPITGAQRS
jgi:hypothetical protein